MQKDVTPQTAPHDAQPSGAPGGERWQWLDWIKAAALALVFLNHLSEQLFGYPYAANPTAGWPALAERIAQWRPLAGLGAWTVPANLLRYVGWVGDQGVQLFLVASGLGLTISLLARDAGARLPLVPFYRRRAARVYPLWWGAHLVVVAGIVLLGDASRLRGSMLLASLAGLRATPGLFYYLAPAWWYVGLLLQLYLAYPLFWYLARRYGPWRPLLAIGAASLLIRGIGLVWLYHQQSAYLDAWQRGAILITRLPEFLFGMGLAFWLHERRSAPGVRPRAAATAWLAALAYALGAACALTLVGMTVAPLLTGAGLFLLLMGWLRRYEGRRSPALRLGQWTGAHSYPLYLLHHPLLLFLVPAGLAGGAVQAGARAALAAGATAGGAILLERATALAMNTWRRLVQARGIPRAALRLAAWALAVLCLLVGGELVVRWRNPQEVMGWGERPSLEEDAAVGWRLKPGRTTHLRWEGYDYWVTANALGFPGPEYPVARAPGTLRIMTVGDAFTSAEGVDTDLAWPRLLEGLLADRRAEVLNLAVTGYGPNQYAAVVSKYAPLYRPDVILIGFFVNDYHDALWTDDAFRASIGFGRADANSPAAILSLAHLRRLVRLRLVEPLRARLSGQPAPHGYLLASLAALERGSPVVTESGRAIVAERLGEVRSVARQIGARVVLVGIPAAVQVCPVDALAYYPRQADLEDAARFDLDQPQRVTRELAQELGLEYLDLREALRAAPECPYQRENMHWTAAGHRLVAATVAKALLSGE